MGALNIDNFSSLLYQLVAIKPQSLLQVPRTLKSAPSKNQSRKHLLSQKLLVIINCRGSV